MIANVISAILWSPAYLMPGMAFGASLEIASRVAGRLVVLILIIAVVLWITTWLVKHVVRLFQAHATDWLQRFYRWSQGRRFIGPVSASLLDPAQGELRGLATLALLLLGSVVLVSLSPECRRPEVAERPGSKSLSLFPGIAYPVGRRPDGVHRRTGRLSGRPCP
ncbi:MAG: hypothetical protein MZV65_20050 [Chromatiales bacterium]|nr:hypothetical protein [Chromatiales bacterium]